MSSRFVASVCLGRMKLYNLRVAGFQPWFRAQNRLLHVPSPFSYLPKVKTVIMETTVSYHLWKLPSPTIYGNYRLLPFIFSCPLPAVILNHDITVLRIWNCTLDPSLEMQISLPSSNEQRSQRRYDSWDFILLPWCSQGLCSCVILRSIRWYSLLMFSHIFKVKISKMYMVHLDLLTLEGGSNALSWDPRTATNSM